jgi:hypothetical protein
MCSASARSWLHRQGGRSADSICSTTASTTGDIHDLAGPGLSVPLPLIKLLSRFSVQRSVFFTKHSDRKRTAKLGWDSNGRWLKYHCFLYMWMEAGPTEILERRFYRIVFPRPPIVGSIVRSLRQKAIETTSVKGQKWREGKVTSPVVKTCSKAIVPGAIKFRLETTEYARRNRVPPKMQKGIPLRGDDPRS